MDVLEIALPHPETIPELESRARATAWGPEENPPCYWRGHLLGQLLPVANATWATRVQGLPTALASQVEGWTLLRVAPEAVSSYGRLLNQPALPELNLGHAIERVLVSQPGWVVWCIRDLDQRPVQRRPMSPGEVTEQLRENVLRSPEQMDFMAWRHEPDRT